MFVLPPNQSEEYLILLFQQLCSQNISELKSAEELLGSCLEDSKSVTLIAKILCNNTVNYGARLQAAIQFKNIIDVKWRKNDRQLSILSDDDKVSIRDILMSGLDEPSDVLSLQIAIVIGRLARLDFPKSWPNLISHLLQNIQISAIDSLLHKRCLLVLHHVVKQLASRRFGIDKRNFREVGFNFELIIAVCGFELAQLLFLPISSLFEQHLRSVHQYSSDALSCVDICLKMIRYLIMYGYADYDSATEVLNFIDGLDDKLRYLFQYKSSMSPEEESLKLKAEKIESRIMKIIFEFQDQEPLAFVPLLAKYLKFSALIISDYSFYSSSGLTTKVHCLNLQKSILLSSEYKLTSLECPNVSDAVADAIKCKSDFYSDDCLKALISNLITRFLVLTNDDLNEWQANPEVFALSNTDSNAWRYSLKAAAESLFVTLMHEFNSELSAMILHYTRQLTTSLLDINSTQKVLENDAMLCAFGLSANELSIDFDDFFCQAISPLFDVVQNTCPILHRRLIWLCGKWIGVYFNANNRPKLYDWLYSSLADGVADIVIKLTAAHTLKLAVDEFEFQLDLFMPYSCKLFGALIDLLKNCSEDDAQIEVTQCVAVMVERCAEHIKPFLKSLIDIVPDMWSSGRHLLQANVLALLVPAVKSLGTESTEMQPILCDLLQTALDSKLPSHAYLFEDGLELWLALVDNSPLLTKELASLYKYMPDLLTIQSENLKICFEILKDGILFRSKEFEEYLFPQFSQIFVTLLKDLRSDGLIIVLKCVEFCLRISGEIAVQHFVDCLLWCAHNLLLVIEDRQPHSVLKLCHSIMSTLISGSIDQFEMLIVHLATHSKVSVESTLAKFVDCWLIETQTLALDVERQKMACVCICTWLMASKQEALSKIPEFLSCLAELIRDVCCFEGDEFVDSVVSYDLGNSNIIGDSRMCESEHDKRMQALRDSDIVFAEPLPKIVERCLIHLRTLLGSDKFGLVWQSLNAGLQFQLQSCCSTTANAV